MDLDPSGRNGPAADTALELMKQIITLAAGILALSATFVGRIQAVGTVHLVWLVLSWLALIFAVLAGLETISAVVKSRLDNTYDWSTGYGRRVALVSKYTFVAGLALFATFAFTTLLFGEGSRGQVDTEQAFGRIEQTVTADTLSRNERD